MFLRKPDVRFHRKWSPSVIADVSRRQHSSDWGHWFFSLSVKRRTFRFQNQRCDKLAQILELDSAVETDENSMKPQNILYCSINCCLFLDFFPEIIPRGISVVVLFNE